MKTHFELWLQDANLRCPSVLERLENIRCLILDVDGVLTNGTIYSHLEGGEHFKGFNTLDGHGIKLLAQAGIKVAIITGRNSPVVAKRAQELGITEIFLGATDKIIAFEELLARTALTAKQCAYMGDDWPDLPIMKRVAFSACPQGAQVSVKDQSDYICPQLGGEGAVRELCDLILVATDQYDQLLSSPLHA